MRPPPMTPIRDYIGNTKNHTAYYGGDGDESSSSVSLVAEGETQRARKQNMPVLTQCGPYMRFLRAGRYLPSPHERLLVIL
jgi:hypothetical protein